MNARPLRGLAVSARHHGLLFLAAALRWAARMSALGGGLLADLADALEARAGEG